MGQKLDQELLDVAKWWTYHKDECTDVHKRLEFQDKAIDHLLWVLGRVVEDLQKVEGRRPFMTDEVLSNIIVPTGVKLHDGIRNRG